ncbi:HWE histidine kinase domain-containing protein [Aureimonas sp. Leaf324]|jgi:two-component sensor histidine kinase/PAS domain-containing protein|uniref:PAS domain-containing sensor histidine kinase n=1 Tax=Aureimonas sp. Leaf324 TaxID=1736336 RepID=UPI000715B6A4|nr:HWE histidine kinase domain-containing protein [Aureimonas sp. Leaf324]KQQ84513.1 hypothetical protein ASF65_20300 [Aureimonas sp. Leaf324]
MLDACQPMFTVWGEAQTLLYNDELRPILGNKHPDALGRPFLEVWHEVADDMRPIVEAAYTGTPTYMDDILLMVDRKGVLEETRFNFSFTPIRSEDERVEGFFCACTETTRAHADARDVTLQQDAFDRSEAKWRTVFETLREGFVIGELIRDAAGRAIDWRYEAVNDAWHDLVSMPRGTATGRTLRDVVPGVEDEWIDEFARVVETGEPARFTRRVGTLDRWYEGMAQPIGGDLFTVIFVEVTDRIKRDRRQATLLTLGDELRDRSNLDTIVTAAARCLADGLEVDRVGAGLVDSRDGTIVVRSDWCEPGIRSLVGQHSLGSFGSYIADLRHDVTVAIDDVHADPRTSGREAEFDAIQTRSLLNLPVSFDGHLYAVVFANARELHPWTDGELQFVQQVSDRVRVALARQRMEDAQRVLTQEMAHRMKNSLAMVQAITTQTLRQAESMEAGRLAIASRLGALARAQDILTLTSWEEADVPDVVRAAIEPHRVGGDRITIDGPSYRLTSQQALGLSLAIHELATNAVKYGALSTDAGLIHIAWSLTGGAFTFRWIENGGPAVMQPMRQGFGSKLIERIVGSYFDGTGRLDYAPGGVRFELTGAVPSRSS